MSDKANPDKPPTAPGPGRAPRRPLPTSSPTEREEWARWVEALGSHFSRLMVRESDYLSGHPDDKHSRESLVYYRHAVGFTQWIAWRIRAGKLRPQAD